MTIEHYLNHIGGQLRGDGQVLRHSISAQTNERLPYAFHQAALEKIEAAVLAAEAAYLDFRSTSPAQRAEFLDATEKELDTLDDDFFRCVMSETALPEARIHRERARTSNQLRLFAGVVRRGDLLGARIGRALAQRTLQPRPDLRQYRMGIGPVAVFGASNFPLAFSTAGGDTPSTLAAGCPVVVKAHCWHMLTAAHVACAIDRAVTASGVPQGVFHMITVPALARDWSSIQLSGV